MAKSNQAVSTNNQTAKMALWKIIVLAVSLTIIAALIVTIIIFACVKVKLTPDLTFNAEQGIIVNYNSDDYKGEMMYDKSDAETLAIINKLNNGFSTSLLNSFTEGLNSKNAYDIKYQTGNSKSYTNMQKNNKYVVCFMFENDHTLKTADGNTFTYGSQESVYKYRQMAILLNDDNNSFSALEIWFFTEASNFREGGSSYVKLTAYGDFSEVLNYLGELAKGKM